MEEFFEEEIQYFRPRLRERTNIRRDRSISLRTVGREKERRKKTGEIPREEPVTILMEGRGFPRRPRAKV